MKTNLIIITKTNHDQTITIFFKTFNNQIIDTATAQDINDVERVIKINLDYYETIALRMIKNKSR